MAAPPVAGRMERIDAGQPFTVVVDYAHSPASLRTVLDLLDPMARSAGGGLVAVFGSAGERDVLKRPMMGRIAGERCRLVVVTEEDPRGEDSTAILREIAEGATAAGRKPGDDLFLVEDRREAIALAFARARPATSSSSPARVTRRRSSGGRAAAVGRARRRPRGARAPRPRPRERDGPLTRTPGGRGSRRRAGWYPSATDGDRAAPGAGTSSRGPRRDADGTPRRTKPAHSIDGLRRQLMYALAPQFPTEDLEKVGEAFDFAVVAHEGQHRASGEAYVTHPIAAALTLAELGLDVSAIDRRAPPRRAGGHRARPRGDRGTVRLRRSSGSSTA